MKKLFIFLMCLALLCVGLAGCGEAEELTTVALNEVTHSVFYAPLYAAMELGYFEEEGIAIELTNGGGADKVMTAILSGQSDIGLAGPESCIYVLQEGREDHPLVFAQLTKRDGSFLVGREDSAFDWNDLRGKTIIGGRKGGVPEMTLEYVMRQNGVIPHEDAVVDTSVQFNMMAGAFTGGNGDFVALFEPTATEVERSGKGHILCSIGEESGEIPYTAFFAAKSFMSENSELIQLFTNAIARAQKWVQETDAAEIARVIAPQFPDTDLDILTAVTERHKNIDAWNNEPFMKKEAFDRLQTVMETAGELSEWVDYNELVDMSFASTAAG
ncbi:MAG: ABC transporter substrate-binding protein [Oscillospiraceae bacterium]|nr:ABC transporter substrate-binding protein [Oscillospiraceae bacterium]